MNRWEDVQNWMEGAVGLVSGTCEIQLFFFTGWPCVYLPEMCSASGNSLCQHSGKEDWQWTVCCVDGTAIKHWMFLLLHLHCEVKPHFCVPGNTRHLSGSEHVFSIKLIHHLPWTPDHICAFATTFVRYTVWTRTWNNPAKSCFDGTG